MNSQRSEIGLIAETLRAALSAPSIGSPNDEDDDFTYCEEVGRFVRLLYHRNWVVDFDWPRWVRDNPGWDSPEWISGGRLDDLKKALTSIVRSERFCSGSISGAFESGMMTAIHLRLEELSSDGKPSKTP